MSHTNLGRAQNAVLLNGLGHDDDSPNDASYDTSNHNFQTLMLAGRDGELGSKVADRTDNHAPLMAVSQTNEPFHGLRRPRGADKGQRTAKMTKDEMIGWFKSAPMGSRHQRMLWAAHKIARLTGVTEGGTYQMLLVALIEAERQLDPREFNECA